MASGTNQAALAAANVIAVDVARVAGRSVILHGSLAAGGFRPGRSDIDLLVVVDEGLTDAQATDMVSVVRRADAGPAAGIDLHVVTAEVAADPSRAPALELSVGDREVERRVAAAPDLVTELSMARADGRALVGAPPRDVIAPIPAGWVVHRGRHWLRAWRSLTDDAEHAAFMVLTTCRIWRYASENVYCPKPDAAAWALGQDPSLAVVRQALDQYEHDPATVVDARGLADLLDTVLRKTAVEEETDGR